MIDVGALVKDVNSRYPPGERSPERMRVLWKATMGMWDRLNQEYPFSKRLQLYAGLEGHKQWERDAAKFVARMAKYDKALASGTSEDEIFPTVIQGLLIDDPNTMHIPDFATPATLSNQIDELSAFNQENHEKFIEDLNTNLKETGDVIHSGTKGVTNLVWAATALVASWTIYKVVTDR